MHHIGVVEMSVNHHLLFQLSFFLSWIIGALYRYLSGYDYSHHPIVGVAWAVLGTIPIHITLFYVYIKYKRWKE